MFPSKSLSVPIACVILSTRLISPASAAAVEFTSAADFNAAVHDIATYNFEGIAPPGSYASQPSFTVGGVNFSPNGWVYVIDANAGYGQYGASFLSVQGGTPSNNVTVTLPGVSAVGFNIGSYIDSFYHVYVTLSTGDSFINLSLPVKNTTEFVGFTSSTPITSVIFSEPNGHVLDFTQFVTASANPVPNPATVWLLTSGLLGLIGAARKRRR